MKLLLGNLRQHDAILIGISASEHLVAAGGGVSSGRGGEGESERGGLRLDYSLELLFAALAVGVLVRVQPQCQLSGPAA
jgi:hypothetical protein